MPGDQLTKDEQDFDSFFEEANKPKAAASKAAPKADDDADANPGEGGDNDGVNNDANDGDPSKSGATPAPSPAPNPPAEPTVAELKAQVATLVRERDEALHKWRSDANRQSNLMQENNRLKGLVADLERQVAELKKTAKANESSDEPDVLENAPELKAAVDRRIREAVEFATGDLKTKLNAAEAKLAEVGQTVNDAAQRVEPLVSREQERAYESIRVELDKRFPSWRADQAAIAAWVQTQPDAIKSMFPGSGLEDSSTVLKLFYADKGAKAPGNSGNGASNDADERLRLAAGIVPRSQQRHEPNKDDFDGAFAEFSASKKR